MIFVTVGTHEQQFDRLLKEVDRLKKENLIQDEVFIQTGYSNYVPKYCKWEKIISFEKMNQLIEASDIIITHGGPATFMGVIAKGKVPIVVPRQKKFGEHVNDHQMDFVEKVLNIYNLTVITNINDLMACISKTNEQQSTDLKTNNNLFMENFIDMIDDLMGTSYVKDE
jgi:glycosyl transferase cpsG(V)